MILCNLIWHLFHWLYIINGVHTTPELWIIITSVYLKKGLRHERLTKLLVTNRAGLWGHSILVSQLWCYAHIDTGIHNNILNWKKKKIRGKRPTGSMAPGFIRKKRVQLLPLNRNESRVNSLLERGGLSLLFLFIFINWSPGFPLLPSHWQESTEASVHWVFYKDLWPLVNLTPE